MIDNDIGQSAFREICGLELIKKKDLAFIACDDMSAKKLMHTDNDAHKCALVARIQTKADKPSDVRNNQLNRLSSPLIEH